MKIADLFAIRGRFLRSANLERDFQSPGALDGYVVTSHIQESLERISVGLTKNSGQRAWRITGDFGSGKSSFGLLLAHLFAGNDSNLPPQLRSAVDLASVKKNKPRYLPVLITGSRASLSAAVVKGVARSLEGLKDKRTRFSTLEKINKFVASKNDSVSEAIALQLLLEANAELIASGKANGLFILLDELGKFLEFAALHPERQDVYFLQQLAEVATRSGAEPLFVVSFLHQGFSAYADQLSQSGQKEWEKIAGRFEELLFDQPLDQLVQLIASALDVSHEFAPRGIDSKAKAAMRSALELGWYGTAPPLTSLTNRSSGIYPLHPTVIPVLVRLFSQFGQNERSLFSFLLSNEPFGLQTFAQRAADAQTFYRIQDLYDYASSSFGHRLSVQTYRNHWNHIDSLVRSFRPSDDWELSIIKTVGILNLINSPELVPTEDALVLAVSDGTSTATEQVRVAMQRLRKETSILYSRGRQSGYCLWSHTSVNLDAVYEEAGRAVGHTKRVASKVKEHLDNRPIVARRHFIKTGNLRHFEVVYTSLTDLQQNVVNPSPSADGRIVIPLCETAEEVRVATEFVTDFDHPQIIIGLTEPLSNLEKLVIEVERWTWVQANTPELKDDRYAAEEVTRQLASATQTLEKRINHYAGLRQVSGSGAASMKWFYRKRQMQVKSSKAFLSLLSDLCDDLFKDAPTVHNELVNRRFLSGAAASARMRVIERMFSFADRPFLGMDPLKKPPEMSIYLSVLRETKLHSETGGKWQLRHPKAGSVTDPCNFNPGLTYILKRLEATPDSRINVETLMGELRGHTLGIRDGLIPILLSLVVIQYQQEIALYENGTFLSAVSSEEILRLTKAPKTFDMQLCKIRGVRLDLFEKLFEVLKIDDRQKNSSEILDVVRPLCVFVSQLPQYARTTKVVSTDAQAVRETILNAKEPGLLLFTDLPKALGFEPFDAGTRNHKHSGVEAFVTSLKKTLEELRLAYQLLKDRLREYVTSAFLPGASANSFRDFRQSLADRAEALVLAVKDPDLKAFALRSMDLNLTDSEWLESIGSLLATTPPNRWKDEDETQFRSAVIETVKKFERVESLNFSKDTKACAHSALRVSLTARDGTEHEKVISLSKDEDGEATDLAIEIRNLLSHNPRISMGALSRVFWGLLEKQ